MKAAYEALGGDPAELELLIMQLVHLVRSGERAQMSKRAGEFVTLDDLVEEIGVDAARWYLLARSHDTTVDLDLDLAREQSSENPVYYVQYAHARIASMLDRAGAQRVEQALEEAGREQTHRAASLRAGARAAAARVPRRGRRGGRAPRAAPASPPTRSSSPRASPPSTATAACVGAEPPALESCRIALCVATMATIARALELLGVAAPDRM